jgi:uncharacterized protein (DUF1800 family)
LALGLSACGGGGSGTSAGDTNAVRQTQGVDATTPMSTAEAHLLLAQASFGPTPASVASAQQMSASAWVDQQLQLRPAHTHLELTLSHAADRQRPAATPDALTAAWWTQALTDPAQLRLRLAYALSQIMVVSTVQVDTTMTAAYLDMLVDRSTGRFRDLLEGVSLHPAMGQYLSHMANRKEEPAIGRVPDENFARELMQLFSIGLYELDDSGRQVLIDGQPVPTFAAADVSGLAQVFTGWSWYRPLSKSQAAWWECFWRALPCQDDSQWTTPMSAYDNEHSTSAKRFLGLTIAPQTRPSARASLTAAMDRLANHNNTGPFISRQLIQKLVTSNPSDGYVRDVVQVWRSTNGQLSSVVRAILLHEEARHPERLPETVLHGQVREPVLRLSHLLRALQATSQTYVARQASGALPYLEGNDTGDSAFGLGQTPMRSPSVFNFYRPGYAPPQGLLARQGAVAPEMQIITESTTLAYANFMAQVLQSGWGNWVPGSNSSDLQFDWRRWVALEADAGALADALNTALVGHAPGTGLRQTVVDTLATLPRDNEAQRLRRVQAATLLLVVSPEFTVQP